MPKSLDCGTMFLVKGEIDKDNNAEFAVERNMFLEAASTEDTRETLKENDWSYAEHKGKYYILGEDAIKLKNLLTISSSDQSIVMTKVGELRRPMKDGLLNTGEEKLSVAIIQKLIASLVGDPAYKDEVLCFCAPGNPIDKNVTNVFHKTMLTNFLKSLGYVVECIPEALAIIFSERPVAEEEDGVEAPFSGLSFSFGSGMMNCCLGWRKLPLINMSVAKSGDWIDYEAARVAGIGIAAMTRYKEKKLDLNNIDYGDMRQAALEIFYQNMIENALTKFSEKFNQLDSQIEAPLEIVVAGGTSMVPGFMDKFKSIMSGLELPFKVKSIRQAADPFYSVSNGCLIKAIAIEGKKTDKVIDDVGGKEEASKEENSNKRKIRIVN